MTPRPYSPHRATPRLPDYVQFGTPCPNCTRWLWPGLTCSACRMRRRDRIRFWFPCCAAVLLTVALCMYSWRA